jgi:hypothetical protein
MTDPTLGQRADIAGMKIARAAAADDAWQPLAEGTRAALANLGYLITSQCLPGEADPCGHGYAEHVAAHLRMLQLVITHHIEHLGGLPAWTQGMDLTACRDLGCRGEPDPGPAGAGPRPG